MGKVIQRPKLKPEANYVLQDNNSKGWIANAMPMKFTNKEGERRTFTGDYLNETAFDWQYTSTATEVPKAIKSKPRPVSPPIPQHHKPQLKKK